jgi:hypothetical protein
MEFLCLKTKMKTLFFNISKKSKSSFPYLKIIANI